MIRAPSFSVDVQAAKGGERFTILVAFISIFVATWRPFRGSSSILSREVLDVVRQVRHSDNISAIAGDLNNLNYSGENKGLPPDNNENGMLVHSIMKLDEDKERLWPEMVRLLTAHADERHDLDLDEFNENTYISGLLKRVGSLTP